MHSASGIEDLIDVEELANETYSLEVSKEKARYILNKIDEEDVNFKTTFKDNIWTFSCNTRIGRTHSINFNDLELISKKHKGIKILELVKCWCAELLDSYVPSTVTQKTNQLISSIYKTDFFSEEKLDDFINYLSEEVFVFSNVSVMEYVNNSKSNLKNAHKVLSIINSVVSFINYLDLSGHESYVRELVNLRRKIPRDVNNRLLPKSKDVLTLNNCIEHYFENGFSCEKVIHFSPILIWWKLTNIIPMRISEFCNISRDCLDEENCTITLPRIKNTNSKRNLQKISTIAINKEMFDLINEYIITTDSYGRSDTLISWKAINETGSNISSAYRDYWFSKKAPEFIHSSSFHNLLKSFYKNIVTKYYHKDYEREVNPNDTRHFAFCSLMLQGISPVEIARLGGHSTIEAQYHYSNHTEYFIDIEVKKLMESYRIKNGQLSNSTISGLEFSRKDVESKSFNYPKSSTRLKMNIGYCTDELQICESEDCMLCSKWWISPEELVDNLHLIEEKINSRKQKITELSAFLKTLNENITTTMFKEGLMKEELEAFETSANEIKSHIEAIARFKEIEGDVYE
ncbi:site-specific integrase [Lysinibacillus sp. JK80]|uniref:site-specific integrase n=1 Tax=Lysinibacillus sp. JK80 TaxID=2749809 RepID=UPI0022B9A521|nr:site-specific integrase [Lysinibacillus sp. JK80]WBF56018.1 site-specific integrase [Lysinibacillus sp. JK80]